MRSRFRTSVTVLEEVQGVQRVDAPCDPSNARKDVILLPPLSIVPRYAQVHGLPSSKADKYAVYDA